MPRKKAAETNSAQEKGMTVKAAAEQTESAQESGTAVQTEAPSEELPESAVQHKEAAASSESPAEPLSWSGGQEAALEAEEVPNAQILLEGPAALEETTAQEDTISPEESAAPEDTSALEVSAAEDVPATEAAQPLLLVEPESQAEEPVPSAEAAAPVKASEKAPTPRNMRSQARRDFLALDLHELDRDLSPLQRKEWESIYTSFRSRIPLEGVVAGKESLSLNVYNEETGQAERRNIICFTVIDYRVKVLIPETELWSGGRVMARHVASHLTGAKIQYIITKIDREGECAIASRRMAMDLRRRAFQHAHRGNKVGDHVLCNTLIVGPQRLLCECHGYDLTLTPRDLSYTAMLDLRQEYSPGDVLEAIIKEYEPSEERLVVSVREVNPNPFDGADVRHPVGCDRRGIISGSYKGGVFCRLPDDVTCLCLYSNNFTQRNCAPGDRVIVHITRYDYERKQIFGRIVAQW